MKLEYMNGVRISKLYHEMSPLEAAINRYEELANKHYAENSKKTNLTKAQRKENLQKSLSFLALERAHLEKISDVQAELDVYREAGMAATKGSRKESAAALRNMNNEAHHPTTILEKYMRAEGIPKPSSKHTAHHILPGTGKLRKLIGKARLHLHLHGIRVNDPANGVYLLYRDGDTPHWSMPNSRGHLTYHTHEYERWVSRKIIDQKHIDFIKTKLQVIGRLLQANEPKHAIAKINKC